METPDTGVVIRQRGEEEVNAEQRLPVDVRPRCVPKDDSVIIRHFSYLTLRRDLPELSVPEVSQIVPRGSLLLGSNTEDSLQGHLAIIQKRQARKSLKRRLALKCSRAFSHQAHESVDDVGAHTGHRVSSLKTFERNSDEFHLTEMHGVFVVINQLS